MHHLPTLHRALRAVPAGGRVLCLADAPAASFLAAERGDQVVKHSGFDLPFDAEEFLVAIAPQAFLATPDRGLDAHCAELCRVASRYTVVAGRHPLPPWGGGERHPHRAWESAFAALGWRPLARAARRPFLDPYWVYVFARFGGSA